MRGADSFAYDQANRLKTATVGGVTTTHAYDGDGKRVSSTTGGSTTTYVYDANRSLPVVLSDGGRKYVWGLGLAYSVDTAGALSVSHADGLGSVRALTDAAGTLVQREDTDPFGVPTATQGTSAQPFRFTGEQRDDTGLYYLRARFYDPALGRFLSRDPVAGTETQPSSLNRYAYVLNNPVNFADPSGYDGCQTQPGVCSSQGTGRGVGDGGGARGPGGGGVINSGNQVGRQNYAGGGRRALPEPAYQNPWIGTIESYITEAQTTFYRVWGDAARKVGSWLSPNRPASSSDARRDLALPSNNSAEFVSEVQVPAGTRVQAGTARENFGQPGGGEQIQLLDRIPSESFGPGERLEP